MIGTLSFRHVAKRSSAAARDTYTTTATGGYPSIRKAHEVARFASYVRLTPIVTLQHPIRSKAKVTRQWSGHSLVALNKKVTAERVIYAFPTTGSSGGVAMIESLHHSSLCVPYTIVRATRDIVFAQQYLLKYLLNVGGLYAKTF